MTLGAGVTRHQVARPMVLELSLTTGLSSIQGHVDRVIIMSDLLTAVLTENLILRSRKP